MNLIALKPVLSLVPRTFLRRCGPSMAYFASRCPVMTNSTSGKVNVRFNHNEVSVKDQVLKKTKWYNELGSVMEITSIDVAHGNFTGLYCSTVGIAEKTYPLVGRFDNARDGRSLGWVVSWHNSYENAHSATTWSGQVQQDPDDQSKAVILTTWLLTSQTKEKDNWGSTQVGFDTFTQDPPDEDQVQRAKMLCRQCSHPKPT